MSVGARDLSSGELSSCSSDDEGERRLPPAKIPRKNSMSGVDSKKQKKNSNCVWQSVLQENAIESAFKSTEFTSKNLVSVERGAETYSFEVTEADEAAEDGVKLGNRKRPLKERLPPRSFDRSVSREHYGVDFDSPPAKVVTAITNFLDEQREDLVELIVKTLGVKRALEFCYLTEDIENAGGLPTADGSRRRTPGGVYFLTIRRSDTVSREERKVIFRETSTEKALKKRLRQAQRRRGRRGAEARLSDPPAANCDDNRDFENLPSPNVYIDEPVVD